MPQHKGTIIVLEGTDGIGKKTQIAMLRRQLRREGKRVATLAFPQYGKKSAGIIEEYLNGKYGKNPDAVNPYAAALFFALDRFDASFKIKRWLAEGKIVLLDRYVDSNAAHQGGKIKNAVLRKKFLLWLYDLEYRLLRIPKPDLVIVLRVPSETGQRLVGKKAKRGYLKKGSRDIHEKNRAHLKNAERVYRMLARSDPNLYHTVSCVRNGTLMPPQAIHEEIWKHIRLSL